MNLRYKAVSDTLALIRKYKEQAGITRLADLSYLDDLSTVKVFSAVRPNAKSITISMGKSIQDDEARCAALMESIETYFAEEVKPTSFNVSQEELANNQELYVNLNNLGYGATTTSVQKLDWCLGKTLLSNKDIYIPHISLSLDSTLLLSKVFGQNSDAIASGSNYEEALIYSFLELVERRTIKTVEKKQLEQVQSRIYDFIDLNSINISFYFYENTFKLPVIECTILNSNPLDNQSIIAGYGCHFSKEVAVEKALLEAIQSRVGVISGARDDLNQSCYNFSKINALPQHSEKINFETLQSFNYPLEQQFQKIIKHLKDHKMDLAVYSYCNEDISILKTFLINYES